MGFRICRHGLHVMENVWQFMRDRWLSNRIFAAYGDIVAVCCEA